MRDSVPSTRAGKLMPVAGSPWVVAHPGLPQIRTCGITASGSSGQRFTRAGTPSGRPVPPAADTAPAGPTGSPRRRCGCRSGRHRATAGNRGPRRWAAMSLAPKDLAAAGRCLAGRELQAPCDSYITRPTQGSFNRLRRLHNAAGILARKSPHALTHPETARAMENALVHAMVTCLTEHIPTPDTFGNRCRSTVMARLARLLDAHPTKPLYLAEICAATGVSERTMRVCCHEHLGMGPVRYLWLRRMHLARAALMKGDPQTTSVTAVAVDHGFWELGRFAVAYRSLFGESPSATLRRVSDAPPASHDSPFALGSAVSA